MIYYFTPKRFLKCDSNVLRQRKDHLLKRCQKRNNCRGHPERQFNAKFLFKCLKSDLQLPRRPCVWIQAFTCAEWRQLPCVQDLLPREAPCNQLEHSTVLQSTKDNIFLQLERSNRTSFYPIVSERVADKAVRLAADLSRTVSTRELEIKWSSVRRREQDQIQFCNNQSRAADVCLFFVRVTSRSWNHARLLSLVSARIAENQL